MPVEVYPSLAFDALFENRGKVNVKLVAGSGKLTAWVNGTKVGDIHKARGDLDAALQAFERGERGWAAELARMLVEPFEVDGLGAPAGISGS